MYIFITIIFIPCLVFSQNKEFKIECIETTGTGGKDIFKINKPEFYWYYNNKWYELSVSKKGVAKDWDISFNENLIRLYNKKMEWLREIDLNTMSAYMNFSSGEQYLYECRTIK
tara:strand:- start:16 stop:357 length:342 start_codon:yes stop_codon:yes gene_type:complete